MWVAVAETIRRCSNSRTSTYKLHIRDQEDRWRVDGAAIPIFKAVMKQNVGRMLAEKSRLRSLNLLSRGKLTNAAVVNLGDICLMDRDKKSPAVDIVLTSPPYGDNRTTVPYGQFSYLALRWIPHEDIDSGTNSKLLETTHSLDTASIGGGNKTSKEVVDKLEEVSPAFAKMHRKLLRLDTEAAKRWVAYCRDMASSVSNILASVRPGGYLVWTIGQRRIRSNNAPLAKVLTDVHTLNGARPIVDLKRKIPTKRMPSHNSVGSLMQTERICFYRKN
jgi:hypothetical protein